MDGKRLIVVLGPTASGKTHKAVALAQRIGGEIISADSRQVYKGMDIGTGKDLCEYQSVAYHLIDICPAGYKYNLYEYLRDYEAACRSIREKGRYPILCGGTGLYIESVLNGLRLPEVPEDKILRAELARYSLEELTEMLAQMKTLHNTTDTDTCKRAIRAIEIAEYYSHQPAEKLQPRPMRNALVIGIEIERDLRRARISHRLRQRLDEGMVEEIRSLLEGGIPPESLIYYGLEYKFVTEYLIGKLSYDEMVKRLEIAIHQFAKRQMTWFRGMERRGIPIHWIDATLPTAAKVDVILQLVQQQEKSQSR